MATEEPGIRPVVLYVNGEAVSTLNPLPATGGGGGGGGGTGDPCPYLSISVAAAYGRRHRGDP